MKNMCLIEYSDDGNEVCIIPKRTIRMMDLCSLMDHFYKEGFKWWVPADERCGYTLVKINGPLSNRDACEDLLGSRDKS